MTRQTISHKSATELALAILKRHGMADEDARLVTHHLLRAEKRGYSSHGLVRVPSIVQAIKASSRAPQPTVSKRDGITLLNGDGCQGIVAVERALAHGREALASTLALVVGVTGYVGTTGCIGVYATELAEANITSIMMCHSEYGVAPYGSARAILGTNPITIGMPTIKFPFVADLATSAWSYGALKTAMRENREVPEGVVQTADGRPSRDPNDADNGSQLPMAAHKGYALGLAIELLCGSLLGSKLGRDAVPGTDAFLAILIKSDAARPLPSMLADTEKLFDEIKSSPLAEGFTRIRIPGETANERERLDDEIALDQSVLSQLQELRDAN